MSKLNRIFFLKTTTPFLLLSLALLLVLTVPARGQDKISGTVYHDANQNGRYDSGEQGIPEVQVSNGREILATDKEGKYQIITDDNAPIFVIKPRGWTTTVDENNIPRFYYIHSRDGAGGTKYPGLEPAGSPPESIDFALYRQEESDKFRAVVFGDTQPRDRKEVNYIAHDTIQELIGVDAAFGITLGDLVFDDLNLFQPINEIIGEIGIPWRHVMGNHDIDYSADEKWDANGTYFRTYGPSYYAFTWASAHFVVVDNIRWVVEEDDRYYRTGLGEAQMDFISNYLDRVPDDELVVFLMHIPLVGATQWKDEAEREELFGLLASHPRTVSLAAHMHRHYHRLIGPEDGWQGEEPHHLISMGAVCGSWWAGAPDEYGIPHSMMKDGTPTGYGFLEVTGNEWKLRYKAARRPADFQVHVYAPDEISQAEDGDTEVFANVFNALPDTRVQMRVGEEGAWQSMNRIKKADPFYKTMQEREHALGEVDWRKSSSPNPDPRHLWQAALPKDLEPGAYTIHVRAEDEWDVYEGHRIIRVNVTNDGNDELFNGEDLRGWEGNMKLWRAEDGMIVGEFDEIEQNEFLRSKTEVEDFRLTLQVRIVDGQGNSGIQFRSTVLPGGHVRGPQADIGKGYWGKLYEELGRALLSEKECDKYTVLDGWNKYEVLAVGSKIRTAVNGNLCTDVDDPYIARDGIIALQLHQGFGPSEIQFKDLYLERNPEFKLITLE